MILLVYVCRVRIEGKVKLRRCLDQRWPFAARWLYINRTTSQTSSSVPYEWDSTRMCVRVCVCNAQPVDQRFVSPFHTHSTHTHTQHHILHMFDDCMFNIQPRLQSRSMTVSVLNINTLYSNIINGFRIRIVSVMYKVNSFRKLPITIIGMDIVIVIKMAFNIFFY